MTVTVEPPVEIVCVGCGCTDEGSCPGGCARVAVDEERGCGPTPIVSLSYGVASRCSELQQVGELDEERLPNGRLSGVESVFDQRVVLPSDRVPCVGWPSK